MSSQSDFNSDISWWTNKGRKRRTFADFDFNLDKQNSSQQEKNAADNEGDTHPWNRNSWDDFRMIQYSSALHHRLKSKSVILPSLIGETKETKAEESSGKNWGPTQSPHLCYYAISKREPAGHEKNWDEHSPNVYLSWVKRYMSWKRDLVAVDERDINTSEEHKSKESSGGNVAFAWEQGHELGTVFPKGNDSRDRVGGSEKPDDG